MSRASTSSALDNGSIAVGGLGGSGTRVIAMILEHAGIDLGADVNASHDNVWFTLLFRRPEWFARHSGGSRRAVRDALDVFHDAMTGTIKVRPKSARVLVGAVVGRGAWSAPLKTRASFARHMLRSTGPPPSAIGWGWKEPNTHVYLPTIREHYADVRYIHVIRHGLDMALSANQNQLKLWSSLFADDAGPAEDPLHRSLQFWYAANKRAITAGETMGDRFLLVDYDELCADPMPALARLLAFVRAPCDDEAIRAACALVERPSSIGRYRSSLDRFTEADRALVRELGFEVST